MKQVIAQIAGVGRCVLIWFVAVLPISPSVWALYLGGWTCFTPAWTSAGMEPATCIVIGAIIAPFAVLFGPLADTVDEPTNPWPAVLGTALLLAVLVTAVSLAIGKWGRRPS